MERYSLSPPSTPEGAAPPEMVPGSSGKLLRAKNKIMSALNRAKTAQRQLDKGAQSRREEKLDELQPAGFSALDTKLKSAPPTHTAHRWPPVITQPCHFHREDTRTQVP